MKLRRPFLAPPDLNTTDEQREGNEMTAETKWTPGPWRVFGKKSGYIVAPDGKDGKSIVQVAEVGAYRDEELLPFNKERWDADALLTSSAPELYEALESADEILFHLGTAGKNPSQDEAIEAVRERANQALRKARGEQP